MALAFVCLILSNHYAYPRWTDRKNILFVTLCASFGENPGPYPKTGKKSKTFEVWTVIGPWTDSRVDRYSESKLEPLTVVCPSTVAVRGPITGQWTAIGPWTAIVDGTAIGYHIYREIQSGIFERRTGQKERI